jgi:hypothetical protein
VTKGELVIPASVVPYLRSGVKRELAEILSIMQVEVGGALDPDVWRAALERLDQARALFEEIGLTDDPDQRELALGLLGAPRLLLRVLQSEHDLEVVRRQDAEHEGFDRPPGDLPELESLVRDLRKRIGVRPRRLRPISFLERQAAKRDIRRRRGD